MQRNALKSRGSPATASAKTCKCGAAKSTDSVCGDKSNSVPGDLLARTIACQPPNEARIRGLAA